MVNNVETEISNVISDNSIGLNVPAGNPEAVANAIMHYLENPLELEKAMKNSNLLFDKSFNRIENSKKYIAYLQEICNLGINSA